MIDSKLLENLYDELVTELDNIKSIIGLFRDVACNKNAAGMEIQIHADNLCKAADLITNRLEHTLTITELLHEKVSFVIKQTRQGS